MIRYFFTVRDFHPLLLAGFSGALMPNPSLKRSANGRPLGPVRWYSVHFHRPGPGGLPLALRLSEGLGLSAPEKPARSKGCKSLTVKK